MELISSSINVVFPLFVMMAAGWLIRKTGLVTTEGLAEMNRLNVRVFLPAMLFINVCDGDLINGADRKFMLFAAAGGVVLFLICILVVPAIVKDKRRSQAIILGMYRPNTAIYGLPLAQSILGSSDKVSNVLMMISVAILVTNFFAVLTVEIYKGAKPKILTSVARCFMNPIIIGLLLGMIAQFLPFRMPDMILSPIKSIGAITTPLAFIALGADFSLKTGKKNIAAVSAATLFKLIVTPLLTIPAGILLFGFRDETLVAMICAFSTPTAVSVLPLIKEAGADGELMGEIIVSTTAFSLVSIFLFTFVFRYLSLL